MQRLAERQRDFGAALLDPMRRVPPGLVGPDGEPSPRRFSVYRNNVVAGLIETLTAAFPAVHRIVGAGFFRAMAGAYAVAEPPRSPILLDYGAGFADFIAGFEPASMLPYLPDVARIERAWTEAYHAPDASSLEAADLRAVDPDRFGEIRLAIHPSLRLVRSPLPALTVWHMNVGDGVPGPVDFEADGDDTLIVRPAIEVEVRLLPPGGAEFVAALAVGKSASEAALAAAKANSAFDLSANLAGLIGAAAFVGWSFGDDAPLMHSEGRA
ncbi:MAG: DNA-binding domain-containing protein [Bradyrhizobium sp.]